MEYKYSLDKSSKKYVCPQCQKKRFVRYMDNSTNLLTSDKYGRCDREENCGYHLRPKANAFIPNQYPKPRKQLKKVHHLPPEIILPTLGLNHFNNLVDYLNNKFGIKKTVPILQDYKVGTSKAWHGATLFWQIDFNQNVRTGKIMDYCRKSGNRIGEPKKRITWVHSKLKEKQNLPNNFDLKQCLFGEHLLTHPTYSNKIVAVVESEKTALIMTIKYPNYLWLACGSKSGIKTSLLNSIKNNRVVLFPDKGCFDEWTEKTTYLNKNGYNIQVSELIEGLNIEKGLDLADLFDDSITINKENATSNLEFATDCNSNIAPDCNNLVAHAKTIYDTIGNPVDVSPQLQYLIDKLELENV